MNTTFLLIGFGACIGVAVTVAVDTVRYLKACQRHEQIFDKGIEDIRQHNRDTQERLLRMLADKEVEITKLKRTIEGMSATDFLEVPDIKPAGKDYFGGF